MSRNEQQGPRRVAFGLELRQRREGRGLTLRELGRLVGYDYSHVSRVENGGKQATRAFAARCDKVLEADGALLEAWSARSTRSRVAQLPAALPNFVGRDAELHQLEDLARKPLRPGASRVVFVDGPAGVGKTSLVLAWAHKVAHRFPDGQLYVDLRGFASEEHQRLEPSQVLEGFLLALGVDEIPTELEQRAALYRSVLADQRILIVLDNAGDAVQVEPLLPGSPGCAVAVTSRSHLLSSRVSPVRVTLGPLEHGEATLLLSVVIGQERAASEPRAIRELARRCGGLPLALRLAAERVAVSPDQPVSEIVTELLSGDGAQVSVLMDELTALRPVFSWSYRALDTEAASLFRFLGLQQARTISAASAAALAGIPHATARRLLGRLRSVHLVESAPNGRYRLHDLVWGYAAERAALEISAGDQADAIERLCSWYLHSAWAVTRLLAPTRPMPRDLVDIPTGVHPLTFDSAVAAVRWCDGELDNIAPIAKMAADRGLSVAAWQMGTVWFDYFCVRRPWVVWHETLEVARRAAWAIKDGAAESWIFVQLAEVYRLRESFPQGRLMCAVALAVARLANFRRGEAWAYLQSGLIALDSHQVGQAETLVTHAQRLFTGLDDLVGESLVLGVRAEAHLSRGSPDRARRVLDEALNRFQAIGYQRGCGWILGKIAAIEQADSDHAECLAVLNEALTAFGRAQDHWSIADTLVQRGEVLYQLGSFNQARRSWRVALDFYEHVGDRRAHQVANQLASLPDVDDQNVSNVG